MRLLDTKQTRELVTPTNREPPAEVDVNPQGFTWRPPPVINHLRQSDILDFSDQWTTLLLATTHSPLWVNDDLINDTSSTILKVSEVIRLLTGQNLSSVFNLEPSKVSNPVCEIILFRRHPHYKCVFYWLILHSVIVSSAGCYSRTSLLLHALSSLVIRMTDGYIHIIFIICDKNCEMSLFF